MTNTNAENTLVVELVCGDCVVLTQTLGTAACRVKPLMSESVELEAVNRTVRAESDCLSQLKVKVTPSFS